MEKILISACFLNNLVRYDGTAYDVENKIGKDAQGIITRWQEQGRLVALCPEMSGGLPVPRPAAEIIQSDALQNVDLQKGAPKVMTITGDDVTNEFRIGAQVALQRCLDEHITIAVLTESSPSCGSSTIYDGHFNARKITGQGVTTALLRLNGIQVFSQFELSAVDCYINNLENK